MLALEIGDRYLNQKQAAALLNCSVKTLQVMRRKGLLKFYRFGHRCVRYLEADVRAVLKEGTHGGSS